MDKMKNISLLGKMQQLISSLQQHIELLENEDGIVRPVDVNLLREKTSSIYNLALQLKSETKFWPENKAECGQQIIIPDLNATLREPEQTERPAAAINLAPENPVIREPEAVIPAPAKQPDKEADEFFGPFSKIENQAESIKSDLQPDQPKTANVATTLDLFGESTVVADKLHVLDNSLAKKIEKSKINDLREAIGINEKFLLVNELFEGNIQYYNRAIDELNSFESYTGAKTYLIELSVLHRWDNNSPAYERIYQLIDRRFGYEV